MEGNILLGKIFKLHGINGSVTVGTVRPLHPNFRLPGTVFLEIEGKQVPFFVESWELKDENTLILKFEDYDNPDRIIEFKGCDVYIASVRRKKQQQSVWSDEITGYRVISGKNIFVGTVKELTNYSGNIVLKVTGGNGKEFLVPFHENLIISSDSENMTITLDLPEGLPGLDS